MRECPAVAKDEIERLQAKGLALSLDDLAWLMSLGQKVESPLGKSNPLKMGVPAVAGSSLLWPETVQALCWLEATADWFPDVLSPFSLGFALAYAREPRAFERLYTRHAAIEAVQTWRQSLDCTLAELMAAITEIQGDAPRREKDGEPQPVRQLALEVEILSGRRPDEVQISTVEDLCFMARLNAKYGSESQSKIDVDESRERLRDLMLAVQEIEKRHANGQ